MPPKLRITEPRAALLRSIADGQVTEWWNDNGEPGEITLQEGPGVRTWVTGKVRVMKAAGLCDTDPADAHLHTRGITLTGDGERALADYDAPKVVLHCGHTVVKQTDVASWCPKCQRHAYTAEGQP